MRQPRRAHSRRAAALFAVVLTVVVVQTAVLVSASRSGADADGAIAKLDATRALFAAEAGASVAMGELLAGRKPSLDERVIEGSLRYRVIRIDVEGDVTEIEIEGLASGGRRRITMGVIPQ